MKTLNIALIPTSLLLAGALLFTGACDEKEVRGAGGAKLGLTAPSDQTIKRGSTNEVAIKVDRGDFTGPVSIEFTGLPAGVTVANLGPIPSGDEMKNFTLRATEAAGVVNDHPVTVIASAADMRVQQTFKLDVEAP
jgi:hypothetical protein